MHITDPQGAPSTPTARDIFGLAWPLAFNAMLLHGIVILDTFLVSFLGEEAVAAMGLAIAIAGLLLGALVALAHAAQILISHAKGSQDNVALKSALGCGVFIGLSVAAVGLGTVWTFGARILANFAHSEDIAAQAFTYLKIFSIVILCETVSQAISCYFNGTGRTKLPFFSHLIEMPVNVGLSVLLIFGLYGFPEMGLPGAAIGSAVAAAMRLAYLVLNIVRRDKDVLRAPGWSQVTFLNTAKHHLTFALPVAAVFFGQAACNAVCALIYARMSLTQFAAITLIMPWVQFVGMAMIAWAQATGIFVGQLLGGRAVESTLNTCLIRSWRVAFLIAALVSTMYFAASVSFPLIYANLQPETLATLWSFTPVLLVLGFPKCSNALCGSTLRAGGDTISVMNIHLFSQWVVRVPLTALFILYYELSATWVFALLLVDEIIKFPMFHLRLFGGKWRGMLR